MPSPPRRHCAGALSSLPDRRLRGRNRKVGSSGYACDVQLVIIILVAALLLMVLGVIISALKWLLFIAAALLAVGVLAGWRPGRRSTYH